MMLRKPVKSFVVMTMLIFLFFGPILCIWTLSKYKNRENYFLNPMIPMISLPVKTIEGKLLDTTKLRGKWILLYFSNLECRNQNQCMPYITAMSTITEGLKKDHHQLIRMWLTTASISKEFTQQKEVTLSQIENHSPLEPNQYYIVDPFGNMILSYKNTTPPDQIITDLQSLMRVSQMG